MWFNNERRDFDVISKMLVPFVPVLDDDGTIVGAIVQECGQKIWGIDAFAVDALAPEKKDDPYFTKWCFGLASFVHDDGQFTRCVQYFDGIENCPFYYAAASKVGRIVEVFASPPPPGGYLPDRFFVDEAEFVKPKPATPKITTQWHDPKEW